MDGIQEHEQSSESPESPLTQAVSEYKSSPHTSENITALQKTFWGEAGKKLGLEVAVPELDASAESIEENEREGRRIVYIPDNLAGTEQIPLIAQAFDMVGNNTVKTDINAGGNPENFVVHSGYRWVDMRPLSDNTQTTEKEARELAKDGREGLNISEYLVAALQSKLTTGKYLDEAQSGYRWTMSRLLSSSDGWSGMGLAVWFEKNDGRLMKVIEHEDESSGILGARFSSPAIAK